MGPRAATHGILGDVSDEGTAQVGASIGSCPECGWGHRDSPRRKWTVPRWRQRVPVAVVCAGLAGLAVWQAVTSEKNAYVMNGSLPVFVQPSFTPGHIRRIAESEGRAGGQSEEASLVADVLGAVVDLDERAPGTRALEVAFGPVEGRRDELWRIGWPTAWVTRSETRSYQNMLTRTGFKPAVTSPTARAMGRYEAPSDALHIPVMARWEWWGANLVHRPPPEETGGAFVETQAHIASVAPALGAVLVAWFGVGFLLWLARRASLRVTPRFARRARWVGAAAAGAGMLTAGILHAGREPERLHDFGATYKSVGLPPGPYHVVWQGYTRIGLTLDDVKALRDRADGDRELARAISSAMPTGAPSSPESALCVATVAETHVAKAQVWTVNRTLPWLTVDRQQYMRRADFGTPEPVLSTWPSGFFADGRGGEPSDRIGFNLAASDPTKPSYQVLVSLQRLGLIVVGLWVLYLASAGTCLGVARLVARRRVARGRCPGCGYQVRTAGTTVLPGQSLTL